MISMGASRELRSWLRMQGLGRLLFVLILQFDGLVKDAERNGMSGHKPQFELYG